MYHIIVLLILIKKYCVWLLVVCPVVKEKKSMERLGVVVGERKLGEKKAKTNKTNKANKQNKTKQTTTTSKHILKRDVLCLGSPIYSKCLQPE